MAGVVVSPNRPQIINPDGTVNGLLLTQILDDLRNGVITVWNSGGGNQKPIDPYLGQLYFQTPLNRLLVCTAIRNGAIAAVWTALATGVLLTSPLTTKGDLWGYTTTDARVPGPTANGQVLTGDNTQTDGVNWLAPSSIGQPYQASLGCWAAWHMVRGASSTSQSDFNCTYTLSTAATKALDTTNLYNSFHALSQTSAATVNATVTGSQPANGARVAAGSVAGAGGYFFRMRMGLNSVNAGHAFFWGLASTAILTNSDPSADNVHAMAAMAADAGDANMQVMISAGGGSTPTKNNLGASFPKSNSQMYDLFIQVIPNSTVVNYRVINLASGADTGLQTQSANVPAAGTTLITSHSGNVRSTGVACTMDDCGWYLDCPPY